MIEDPQERRAMEAAIKARWGQNSDVAVLALHGLDNPRAEFSSPYAGVNREIMAAAARHPSRSGKHVVRKFTVIRDAYGQETLVPKYLGDRHKLTQFHQTDDPSSARKFFGIKDAQRAAFSSGDGWHAVPEAALDEPQWLHVEPMSTPDQAPIEAHEIGKEIRLI